jgi:hypothetical protein
MLLRSLHETSVADRFYAKETPAEREQRLKDLERKLTAISKPLRKG